MAHIRDGIVAEILSGLERQRTASGAYGMAVDGPAWLKKQQRVERFFLCREGIVNCGIECYFRDFSKQLINAPSIGK